MDPRSLPVPRPGEPGGIDPRALASYYSYPRQYDGAGTSIALVCLYGGYRRSDLETYFAAAGQPVPDIEDVAVGGARNDPAGDPDANVEVTRDLEILGSVAPGARLVAYFAGNNEQGVADGLARAIFDAERENSVVCLTWCIPESQAGGMLKPAVESLIEDAAAMGKTVCAPSGRSGRRRETLLSRHFPVRAVLRRHRRGTGRLRLRRGPGGRRRPARGQPAVPAAELAGARRRARRTEYQRQAGPRRELPGGRDAGLPLLREWRLAQRGRARRGRVHVGGPAGPLQPGARAALGHDLGLLHRPRPGRGAGPGGGTAEAARPGWAAGTGWGTPDGERLLAVLQDPQRARPGRRGR